MKEFFFKLFYTISKLFKISVPKLRKCIYILKQNDKILLL